MNAAKHREEHANTLLAQVLRGLGVDAKAEIVEREHRAMPDIKINTEGRSVIVEAKYNDKSGAEESADGRLKGGFVPDIIGAISYADMYKKDFARAIETGARVSFAFKNSEEGKGGWQNRWRTGSVYDLAMLLRRPDAAVRMPFDEVQESVRQISQALKEFSETMHSAAPRRCEDLAVLLQASLPVAGKEKERKIAVEQSVRLAGLVLIGAFLFQFALSDKDGRVKKPEQFFGSGASVDGIAKHWKKIWREINYAAIFRVALAVLQEGGPSLSAVKKLMQSAAAAREIARDGVDLMGVAYHKLLAELAKPLGAYYTTIPAATMLSALALAPQKWKTKWAKETKKFRIADLACGSGTLLAAACGQVVDNAARGYMQKILGEGNVPIRRPPVFDKVQKELLEDVVWGYDVLETAVHLTATTLGLMSPETNFHNSHIYCAAIGVNSYGAALAGSFGLLDDARVQRVLFDSEIDNPEERITHVETGEELAEPLPPLDLCIMNPPFVVGTKNAPSYSFLQPADAEKVRRKMNIVAKRHRFSNFGLGPGFVALGEKYIKPGGRMAFVMTSTFAEGRGVAWSGARERVEKTCDLEFLITSRECGRFNFSASTNLQECMFVARKRENGEEPKDRALFCVLSQNPQDGSMAHATAMAILDAEKSGDEWGKLRILDREIGEFALLPYRGMPWDGIAFLNLRLAAAVRAFDAHGKISPYSDGDSFVPVRSLREMAKFGNYSLHRYTDAPQIKEKRKRYLAFSEDRKGRTVKTRYAGYYPGHHKRMTGIGQKDITRIAEEPNCHFLPLPKCDAWAKKYFSWGGRIVINTSFGFSTSRRLVSLISVPVQGANYQPVRLHNDSDARAKAMTLWLNSSPAVMIMAAHAVGCGGAKVMLSQKAIGDMPVLDLDALTAAQLKSLAGAFDRIAKMEFMPIPAMAECPARKAVDDAIAKALKLNGFDFAELRGALAAEPIINGK